MIRNCLFVFFCVLLLMRGLDAVGEDDEEENLINDEENMINEQIVPPLEESEHSVVEPQNFVTPDPEGHYHFVDGFKDNSGIGKRWFLSQAKKDGVDENIAKYNGEWEIGQPETIVLKNDYGLIIKTKARHHAIAAKLDKPFEFGSKPLIVQYDILFQNGQECGGAYVKLLTHTKGFDPKSFHDKSPYTIMFGPDKCGLQSKFHFIIRYKNPKNGVINEHHAKQPDKSIENYITDKKSHLYTLVLNPDGSYRTYIDQKEVSRGKLTETLEPSIFPPKEIVDPEDKKPEDWDEREKIPDPQATKPDDWDETIPETIEDQTAKKPDGWLEDEAEYLPDEKAVKPDDWDEEMDGKWEAPLVKNPKCEGAPGCGKWTPPKINNPAYKGKWKAPMISNPNYKGKWKAHMIENPAYFEDSTPFNSLEPIGAIGLELWTMSDGIVFDNFIITDDKNVADSFASATWLVKHSAEGRAAEASSFFGGLVQAANEKPWLWAVYLLVILIPIVLITVFCCTGGSKNDETGRAKKLDTSSPDVIDDEGDNPNTEDSSDQHGYSVSHQQSRRSPKVEESGHSVSVKRSQDDSSNASKKIDLEDEESDTAEATGSENVEENEAEEAQEEEQEKPTKQTSPRRRTRKAE